MKSLIFMQILPLILFTDGSAEVAPLKDKFKNVTDNINADTTVEEECPEKMYLQPIVENSDKMVCDCGVNDLYFTEDNSCYPPYTRGPCPFAHYLILNPGEKLAKCAKNPCKVDGQVPFNNLCVTLGQSTKACLHNAQLIASSGDFQLKCAYTRILNIITAPPKTCPPGTRRATIGTCKHAF